MTRRVALIEPSRSTPGRDGGARAVRDLVTALRHEGWRVDEFALDEVTDRDALLQQLNDPLLVVVASRPEAGLFTASRRLDRPFKIFLGHDLHHRRLTRWREVVRSGESGSGESRSGESGSGESRPRASGPGVPDAATVERVHRLERRCWLGHHVSLYPDPAEADVVNREVGHDRAMGFPYFVVEPDRPTEQSAQPEAQLSPAPDPRVRPSYLFIGGSAHAPNRDGVGWFVRQVLPVWGGSLRVVGDWSAGARTDFATESQVDFTGPLDEEELREAVRSVDQAVAPLRFGAGVKHKVLHYLKLGLRVIATPTAVEGLPRPLPSAALVVAPPQDWPTLQHASPPIPVDSALAPHHPGARYLRSHFSRAVLIRAWQSALEHRSTSP